MKKDVFLEQTPGLTSAEKNRALPGFSIVEIAISLVIIGILTGLAFKSVHLIEVARLRAVPQQVEEIRSAVTFFVERHGVFPGGGTLHSGVKNRDAWKQLAEAGLYPEEKKGDGHVKAKIGGVFSFIQDPVIGSGKMPGVWLKLSRQGQGGLTPQQAQEIDQLMDDGDPKEGGIRAEGARCLNNQDYDLSHKDRACTLFFRLED